MKYLFVCPVSSFSSLPFGFCQVSVLTFSMVWLVPSAFSSSVTLFSRLWMMFPFSSFGSMPNTDAPSLFLSKSTHCTASTIVVLPAWFAPMIWVSVLLNSIFLSPRTPLKFFMVMVLKMILMLLQVFH